MKNQRLVNFITFSFFLHGLVLLVLFFEFQEPPTPGLTTIDFVQASEQKSVREKVPVLSLKKPVVTKTPPEKEAELANPPALATSSKEEAKTFRETDIEAVLRGRAPKNETEKYLAELRDQIARQQVYPVASRSFREEGVVQLRLLVLKDGRLQKIEILEASQYPRLDKAALTAVSRAAPFKEFPAEVNQDLWRITLPVRFSLSM